MTGAVPIPGDPRPDVVTAPIACSHLPGPARAQQVQGRSQQAGADPAVPPAGVNQDQRDAARQVQWGQPLRAGAGLGHQAVCDHGDARRQHRPRGRHRRRPQAVRPLSVSRRRVRPDPPPHTGDPATGHGPPHPSNCPGRPAPRTAPACPDSGVSQAAERITPLGVAPMAARQTDTGAPNTSSRIWAINEFRHGTGCTPETPSRWASRSNWGGSGREYLRLEHLHESHRGARPGIGDRDVETRHLAGAGPEDGAGIGVHR